MDKMFGLQSERSGASDNANRDRQLAHGNQFSKKRKCDIIEFMKNNGITEYFEEVEITREYDGYYYSVSEAIT
ncbi:MAG: hypothetical protein II059_11135, partial [Clostridia bacterium]|nr:hypothetical protein [Clostridia bacterium]